MKNIKAIITIVCITAITLTTILLQSVDAKDITIAAVSGLVGYLSHGTTPIPAVQDKTIQEVDIKNN